jgi:hypothetical protein
MKHALVNIRAKENTENETRQNNQSSQQDIIPQEIADEKSRDRDPDL